LILEETTQDEVLALEEEKLIEILSRKIERIKENY